MHRKQSTADCKSISEFQTIESPTLKSADMTADSQERKRYNIISEELRKQIIKKLTTEKKSIKEVSKEFGLKLSTCKAILQVYLKEGRIGKKTTRDRKTKIINTLLIATIHPLNPLQSTLLPYVQISDYKCSQKKMEENEQQDVLVSEAIQKAAMHFQGVLDQNAGEGQNVTIPQESLNMLQNIFMQTQMQTLSQLFLSQSQNLDKANFTNHINIDEQNDGTHLKRKYSRKQYSEEEEGDEEDDEENTQTFKKEEEDKIDGEIIETIHKKIFQENKNFIRKNSIIIQKQSEDITNL